MYASGFNDYASWSFDTADEYSAENAWMSSTQSASGGVNTGIINYGGNVYVFKRDATFEITNTKNPFRIHEVFQKGAISQTAVCVVGSCLIFVSHDAVMLYNGSSLKDIGYNLGVSEFYSAVTGTDGRKLYLYCKTDTSDGSLFVYDSYMGLWSEEAAESEIKVFAQNKNGVYAMCSDGIYHLDTGDYSHDWFAETDLVCNASIDIKHISKVQILADIGAGSEVRAYILYDDEEFSAESSHMIFHRKNDTEKTVRAAIRVLPRKTACYGFKIRIEGYGFSKIYQMELLTSEGGEKYIDG